MLDLNHPRTPHVFAALRQHGLVLPCAKVCTLASGNHRNHQFLFAEPAFVALKWLNQNRFDCSPEIASSLDELESRFLALANIQLPDSTKHATELKNCPVCENAITESGTYNPIGTKISVPAERYCTQCLSPIVEMLNKCGSLFGFDAI